MSTPRFESGRRVMCSRPPLPNAIGVVHRDDGSVVLVDLGGVVLAFHRHEISMLPMHACVAPLTTRGK